MTTQNLTINVVYYLRCTFMRKYIVADILTNAGRYQINISHLNVQTEDVVQSNNLSF